MADPIVIAHVLSEQGECLCRAPDAAMSVDLTFDVVARGRWDSIAVVQCGSCHRAALGASPSAPLRGRVGVAVGAAS